MAPRTCRMMQNLRHVAVGLSICLALLTSLVIRLCRWLGLPHPIPCATPIEWIVSGKSYLDTMALARPFARRYRLTRLYSAGHRGNTACYNRSLVESQRTLCPSSHYFREHNGDQPERFQQRTPSREPVCFLQSEIF